MPKIMQAYTAAAITGAGFVLGNLAYSWWLLSLICFVPMFWAISQRTKGSLKHNFCLGVTMGFVLYALGYSWLFVLAESFIAGPVLVSMGLWFVNGIYFALGPALAACMSGFLWQCSRRRRETAWLALICPWLLWEWLQPELFPAHLGTSLLAIPVFAQSADLGGPLLLSALLLACNMCCYEALSNKKRLATVALALVMLIVLPWTYGQWRITSLAATADNAILRLGMVQANLDGLDRDARFTQSHATYLEMSRELLAGQSLDLLVWPESVYPIGLRGPLPFDAQSIIRDLEVPLLFGGTSLKQLGGRQASSNSVFLVNAHGVVDQKYDKQRLIPFAERLPFSDALVAHEQVMTKMLPHYQSFSAGTEHRAIILEELALVTPICFEMIHASFIREMVHATDADMIITLANDGWFETTRAPVMHLKLAQLRAIETRRWVVRATNSGISAIINPKGQIHAQTGSATRETLYASFPVYTSGTLYLWLGDWPGWLTLIIVTALYLQGVIAARLALKKPLIAA